MKQKRSYDGIWAATAYWAMGILFFILSVFWANILLACDQDDKSAICCLVILLSSIAISVDSVLASKWSTDKERIAFARNNFRKAKAMFWGLSMLTALSVIWFIQSTYAKVLHSSQDWQIITGLILFVCIWGTIWLGWKFHREVWPKPVNN